MTHVLMTLLALVFLSLCSTSDAQAQTLHRKPIPWGSAGLGLGVSLPRRTLPTPELPFNLQPSGDLSFLFGADFGAITLGTRIDVGLGGIRVNERDLERGMGYALGLGQVMRATLLDTTKIGLALLADFSWLHHGTSAEDACADPCDPPPRQYPQFGIHGVAPGMSLQFTRRVAYLELRYQRVYWYQTRDEAFGNGPRDWDLLPTDRILVAVGGFFDGQR